MFPTKPFSVKQMVAEGFGNQLSFDGASQPEKGLYAKKLGFNTTLYYNHPPALLKHLGFDDSMESRQRLILSSYPAAFSINDMEPDFRPRLLLESCDAGVKVRAMRAEADSDWMINADGDEVWFVYSGAAHLWTAFGHLLCGAGDFVYIPRGVAYQFATRFILLIGIESAESLGKPDFGPYINADIPYSDAALKIPDPSGLLRKEGQWSVKIKREDQWMSAIYLHSPEDCLGWRGSVYPFVLSSRDIHPLSTHTIHLDPTAHTVFATAQGSAMISAFLPRYLYSLPYYHMNHADEFLFYATLYAARGGIVNEGDATFHPQGFDHGPNPKAFEQWRRTAILDSESPRWVNERAVMFESRERLFLTPAAKKIEIPDYRYHWFDASNDASKNE